MRIAIGLGAVTLAFSLAAAAEPKTYEVRFERPFSVGDTATVETNIMTQMEKRVVGGQALLDDYLEVNARATYKIVSLTPKGEPKEQSVVLNRFRIRTKPDQPWQTASSQNIGLRVIVSPKQDFTRVDGVALSATEISALEILFPTTDDADASDDEMFGPPGPVSAGQSWPIKDSQRIATTFAPGEVDPKGIRGNLSLKGLKTIASTPCLQVEGLIEFARLTDVSGPDGRLGYRKREAHRAVAD